MDWVQIVRDIGFPILVALILLLKLDTSLNNLKESVDELTHMLKVHLKSQGFWGKREEDGVGGGD